MKTEKVFIKEFKCLENFEQEINGNHILIMGDNGVGKSTFIQFIEIALGKQTNIPPGAKGEGFVMVSKDGKPYKFNLKFKDGKPVLTVDGPDGMRDSRKGTIASIVGAMDFDIMEFVELSKSKSGQKKQVEIFKSFLTPEVRDELARHESNVMACYNDRTDLNRLIKEKEGAVKSHRLYNVIGIQKFEKVDVSEIMNQMKAMNEHNNKVHEVHSRFEARGKEIEATNKTIADLEKRLAEQREVLSVLNEKQGQAADWLKSNPLEDMSIIEKQVNDAGQINKDFDDAERLQADIALLNKMQEDAEDLTVKIETSREAIRNAIREMASPVAGLSYDDETLIYNGVPVNPDTLSTSEIMELGVKMKMAENPDLGILFIQRAESLGADRFKQLKEIADKEGWQIIAEQVERGQKSLHIEIMTEELITA